MRILFLSFYFEPDLCAGSFRNTALFHELRRQLPKDSFIYVLTTLPNRYKSFKTSALPEEKGNNYVIRRIRVPEHKGGMADQAKSFSTFYRESMRLVKNEHFDLLLLDFIMTPLHGDQVVEEIRKFNKELYILLFQQELQLQLLGSFLLPLVLNQLEIH